MSQIPEILSIDGYANLSRDRSGAGTPDWAYVNYDISQNHQWLEGVKRPCGGWGRDVDGATDLDGVFFTASTSYQVADFTLPTTGSASNVIFLGFLISDFTTGGLKFQLVTEAGTSDLGSPTADGWLSVYAPDRYIDQRYPPGDGLHSGIAKLTAVPDGSGTTPHFSLQSFSVWAGTDATISDWRKANSLAIRNDTADSTHWIKVINDQTMYLANKYSKTLYTHSFRDMVIQSSPYVVSKTAYYRVFRGPRTSEVVCWVYVSGPAPSAVDWDGVLQFDVAVNATTTTVTYTVPVLSDPFGSWVPVTIPVLDPITSAPVWTQDSVNDLTLVLTVVNPPETLPVVIVQSICAYESGYDPADVLVVDPGGSGRTDQPPQTYLAIHERAYQPGAPIVGSAWGTGLIPPFADRRTLTHNSNFLALYFRQNLLLDCPFGKAETSASWATPGVLYRWMHLPTRGAVGILCRVHIQRSLIASEVGFMLQVQVGTNTPITQYIPYGVVDRWLTIGSDFRVVGPFGYEVAPLSDNDTAQEVVITAGFSDAVGNGISGIDDVIRITGVEFEEIGGTAGTAYHYRSDVLSTTIPHTSSGTHTDQTYTVTSPFVVRHLRVLANITGNTAGDYKLTLVSPHGESVVLKEHTTTSWPSTTAPSTGWWSDDVMGDASPDHALSGLYGYSAAGTWTLQIENTGAADGSLTNLILEIE